MSANLMPYRTGEELLREILPATLCLRGSQKPILEVLTSAYYVLLLASPKPDGSQEAERIWNEAAQKELDTYTNIRFFDFRGHHLGILYCTGADWEAVYRETIALESELEQFFTALRDRSGITINLSVGRPFQGMLHLQDAYSELINSTKTFSIRQEQLVVSEFDIVNDPVLMGDPYPQSEIERRLVDNILNLEIRKAHQVMEEIIRYERSTLRLTLSFLPRIAKRVEWILIVLHVPRNSGDPKSADIYSYPYRIQYAEGNEEGEKLTHEFFDKLEDYYQAFRFNVGKDISQITGFIQDNYENINLDATMICDRFRISPSYLSHMFKKRTGVRLLDYIHGIRIERARELLAKSDMPIRDIGTAVGYVSNATFSTTFKKYEAMTPTQYREKARSQTRQE